jgi:hypothetical protein
MEDEHAASQHVAGDTPTSFSADDEHVVVATREVEGRWKPWPMDGRVLDLGDGDGGVCDL